MAPSRLPLIDLIVPARNEQANIPGLLAAVPRQTLRHLIIVDNGSVDDTAPLARRGGAVVVNEPRRGYGSACLAGLRWIEARVRPEGFEEPPLAVAFLDADLADDPSHLPRLFEPIATGEADLVMGSRVRLAESGALETHQRLGNALARGLIGLITAHHYRDLGPMRAIRWSSLGPLAMRDRTWGWTVEMQFKAARLGLRVRELDVPYRRRRAGHSKISGSLIGSMRAGIRIIATIVHLWWTVRRPVKAEPHHRAREKKLDRRRAR